MTDAYSCPTDKTRESEIMDALLEGLRVQAQTAVEMRLIWEEQRKKHRKDAKTIWKTITALKEDRNQRAQQIKSLYEAYALEEIGKSEYLAAKATATRECEGIDAKIAELEAELEDTAPDGKLNNGFVASFQQYIGVEEITREIVSDVLKEVRIFPDGRLEIVWNYGEDYRKILLDLIGGQNDGDLRCDCLCEQAAV